MSTFDHTDGTAWEGREIARTAKEVTARARLAVTGTVVSARSEKRGSGPAYRCTLDDGTGQIDLLFVGRRSVPGLTAGACCTAEGTAGAEGDRLVVWNPFYVLHVSAGPAAFRGGDRRR